jgi:hypothetical protein
MNHRYTASADGVNGRGAGIGHNSGDLEARRNAFVAEITEFVQQRRQDEALTRQQLAKLDSLGRLQAQRQSILDNVAHYYARHPNADVAPGLVAVITFYSDNNEGACALKVARLAKFLSRSPTAIKEAFVRLERDRIIIVESGKKANIQGFRRDT